MTRAERLLRELIALPSVNPAFLPPGDARGGEGRVADFLAAQALAAGLEVELQPVLPGRLNLLVRLIPRGRAQGRVLLAPHLDTVNGEPEQFEPRAQRGRIYGRGACDTKGSVAAMFEALLEVARSGKRPARTEIVFAGLVDEERAQAGSRALAAGEWRADLAVVGEPTRLKAVTAHKGSLPLRLETRGKAAHGCMPKLGRNAIHQMSRIVELLETRYAAALKRRRHSLLGHGTVSVGVIQGGVQPNIVPATCWILVDRRTLPGERESGVRQEIRALLRAERLKARVTNHKTQTCPPLETDPRLPLVAAFLRAAGVRRPSGRPRRF